MEILYLAAIGICAVLLARAALFRPMPTQKNEGAEPEYVFECDSEEIGRHLGDMIKLKTVSHRDMSQMDMPQFEEFPRLLRRLYPLCAQKLEFERAGITGLIYRWKGQSSAEPSVLMAHYDVVPAEEEKWSFPPFCGEVKDGFVLGRGALDTKCTLCAVFEAVERCLAEGYIPKNDIYLCFSGTEETAGEGAHEIVSLFEKRGISPCFTLDEGGAVVDDILPGVKKPCAIIGVAEKGQMMIRISAEGRPGHASMPPKKTAAASLAKALCDIEKRPFPIRLTQPVLGMINVLGRYAPFWHRVIYASPRFFLPMISLFAPRFGGEVNALLRTTVAFTMLTGSGAANVLPSSAQAVCDVRVLPGRSCAKTVRHLRRAAGKNARVSVISAAEPSPASKTDGAHWDMLCRTVQETQSGTAVSPYLMVARSDSSVYTKICRNVYRFAPIALSLEESATIHAENERIPLEKLALATAFYYRLIQKL